MDLSRFSIHATHTQVDEAVIKFCVPSSVVGSVIGKGGEYVNECMRQSQTRIHLSKQQEVFPGTNDRICTISATTSDGVQSVLTALHLILTKIRSEDTFGDYGVRLISPSKGCGAVIGKGGNKIKSITEESGCKMKVSEQAAGLRFRLLSITGTVDEQLKAVALCLEILVDSLQDEYASQLRDFHGVGASMAQPGMAPPLGGLRPAGREAVVAAQPTQLPGLPQVTATMVTTCVVRVPDEMVGSVIGRGGNVVQNIMKQSGSLVKVSDKQYGDPVRTVTITGAEANVRNAFNLVYAALQGAQL